MKHLLKIVPLILLLAVFLPACGGSAPPLPVDGQATVVFIFTNG